MDTKLQKLGKLIRRNLFAIISITLSAILMFTFFFLTDGVKQLGTILLNSRVHWLLYALLCLALYWFFEAFTTHIITLHIYNK